MHVLLFKWKRKYWFSCCCCKKSKRRRNKKQNTWCCLKYGEIEVMEDEVYEDFQNNKDKEIRGHFENYIIKGGQKPTPDFDLKDFLSQDNENLKTFRMKQSKKIP